MEENNQWWPLSLPLNDPDILNYQAYLDQSEIQFDKESWLNVEAGLNSLMLNHIDSILERDGLSYYCHIVNGWGNGQYKGQSILDRIGSFIHFRKDQSPFVLQCHPEGEVHPWQTFAYAMMAGVSPLVLHTEKHMSLAELANSSTDLNTPKGTELGHLLYALTYLVKAPHQLQFRFDNQLISFNQLVNEAVTGHIKGDFEVCRKFHLTEGLCAVGSQVDGMENLRPLAEIFLKGQLDMNFPLGVILHASHDESQVDEDLVNKMRKALVMNDNIENHAYYAGHIIELAGLVALMGYEISERHWRCMVDLVNNLNRIIPQYLSEVSFEHSFLHFGHYRRAITMLHALSEVGFDGSKIKPGFLSEFTVHFDDFTPIPIEKPASAPKLPFTVFTEPSQITPKFKEVLEAYEQLDKPVHGLALRGKFDHFRRIVPEGWPRAIHYEFLDYDSYIGLEIHIESDALKALSDTLASLVDPVTNLFADQLVKWDEKWYQSSGRMAVIFTKDQSAETIAKSMLRLIDETMDQIDEALQAVAF